MKTLFSWLVLCVLFTHVGSALAYDRVTYIHSNGLGSPVAASDENGDLEWRAEYYPFGKEFSNTQIRRENNISFAGKPTDQEIGLAYFGARHYDPEIGRFTSIDPVPVSPGDYRSFNRYVYGYNNPYGYIDPDGRSPLDIGYFIHDVGRLLVVEIVYAAAVVQGDTAVANLALDGMVELRGDAAMSTLGLVNPVPGTSLAAKANKIENVGDVAAKGATQLCFVEGTPVHTKDGLKPIEEIEIGDLVASKNEQTGEVEWKPVVELFRNNDKEVLNIGFANPFGKLEILGVTAEHPFWVDGKGWTNAGELAIGDEITTLGKGIEKVASIATDAKKHTTYNFEVEDFHTYFVGESALWVHNQCRGLWQLTKEGTAKVVQHGKFGKFHKSKSDGLWWSKDTAGHGGSKWKVFTETKDGLKWRADADQFGDFIVGKHKGDTGKFIPWKELRGK